MVPYKLQMFKDPFTAESALAMFNYYLARGYDESRCFGFTFSNLNKGIFIDGRGRKVPVEYNLSKYTDEEFKAKLEAERNARAAKQLPKELPKSQWIQKGLFDDNE